MTTPPLCIQLAGPEARTRVRAEQIASRLGVPISPQHDTGESRFILRVGPHTLELRTARSAHEPGMQLNWGKLAARFAGRSNAAGVGRSHPLGKAIGRSARRVIDATAGTGQDTLLLAAMGCEVHAIERSAVLIELLNDALAHARTAEGPLQRWAERISICHGNATQVLSTPGSADVVYIDPMFPAKRNESALPRKSIQMIRELVGVDTDACELLRAARDSTIARVVMKRPDHVRPLMEDTVARFSGKLVRYDVYVD